MNKDALLMLDQVKRQVASTDVKDVVIAVFGADGSVHFQHHGPSDNDTLVGKLEKLKAAILYAGSLSKE